MSSFHSTFHRLLKAHDLTQAELVRRTKISSGMMSKYFNDIRPEAEALEKLASAFETDGPTLVAAWLRDEIPAALRGKVTVEVTEGTAPEEDDLLPLLRQLGAKESRVFSELIKRSLENPGMLPLLRQLLNVTGE